MIDPKPEDIGRKVIYREQGNHPGRKVEEGELVAINRQFAFVRYGTSAAAAATSFEDLEWA